MCICVYVHTHTDTSILFYFFGQALTSARFFAAAYCVFFLRSGLISSLLFVIARVANRRVALFVCVRACDVCAGHVYLRSRDLFREGRDAFEHYPLKAPKAIIGSILIINGKISNADETQLLQAR